MYVVLYLVLWRFALQVGWAIVVGCFVVECVCDLMVVSGWCAFGAVCCSVIWCYRWLVWVLWVWLRCGFVVCAKVLCFACAVYGWFSWLIYFGFGCDCGFGLLLCGLVFWCLLVCVGFGVVWVVVTALLVCGFG